MRVVDGEEGRELYEGGSDEHGKADRIAKMGRRKTGLRQRAAKRPPRETG